MSGFSRHQKRRQQEMEQMLQQGQFPDGRYRPPETTKETVNSLSSDRKREGSPLGAAAPSRSSQTWDEERGSENLLSAARAMFPARRKLYSTDVFGSRHEIETKELSEAAYQSLLEAIQSPDRYDGPAPEGAGEATQEDAPREVSEGYKIGPLTELPMPEWWELPEAGASGEEIQKAIQRNIEKSARFGKRRQTLAKVMDFQSPAFEDGEQFARTIRQSPRPNPLRSSVEIF